MKTNYQEKSLTDILTNTNTNVGETERLVSAVGGGLLTAYGINRGDTFGILLSVLGGGLLLRGATGHCQVYDAMGVDSSEGRANFVNLSSNKSGKSKTWKDDLLSGKVHVKKSLTINKPVAELYQFWRNFENLPQFMQHLESVKTTGDKTSHWKAKAPLGQSVEWDAEVTSDRENERIGWKSLEGADIPNSGVVEFKPTINRGTEVTVTLTYEAPGGQLGAMLAKLFGEEPSQQVYGDLYRFKSLMEAGELIKVEGQTSGREPQAKKASA
jgi:uncharacterized membrane protein